ncbi:MAG: hypothetical protein IPH30_02040 [Betaproteobacteria bacterium]|nr:hypothetical protein [Betaproteobacteria bacterium]
MISATSDPGYRSSRRLLRDYAKTALESGWVVVAADAVQAGATLEDEVPLRLALNSAALAVLRKQWPGGGKAPLAFGGFSGGAKHSCWLAAAFAKEGRTVIGLYLAGVNEETLVPAAKLFGVLDASFRRIPVFLQSGKGDEVATPADHRDVVSKLKRAGFTNLRLEYFQGTHEVEPGPLRSALDWYLETAGLAGSQPVSSPKRPALADEFPTDHATPPGQPPWQT